EFLNSSSLSPRLRSIIDNIELLHRCSEETEIERTMRESSRHDAKLLKARRIERSIPGYDAVAEELAALDDIEDSQSSLSVGDDDVLDPAAVVRSGLLDREKIDEAMQFLRLRGRMNNNIDENIRRSMVIDDNDSIEEEGLQLLDNESIRSSNNEDDKLVEAWK